ncbi:EAL domain-containing protein [Sulfurimonas autotrophica]|uniref:Diguanylate cyclase/phosphodiesterase with PAS/PAC sensor(S) n=1 Tax=Sulfurimonas autotrophica (strain ATCC BAA-671 / DSM 16294 / JCM 11897 / OK10) TaxID=563040 RepID=E0URH0_SULAO|nr:EAL domain-containing protein [Sulfurimonas autotrophica]ADN10056.1 diguanylate cyclase/phosphodiesterase with PAS/PAC sensor(s) [Sulfurimonas autotrophica DSM 16294]
MTLLGKWKRYLFILFVLLTSISLAITLVYYKTNTQKIANEILNNQNTYLQKSLNLYKNNLEHIAKDWAIWDETYNFVKGISREKYIQSDFGGDETLINLNIDAMLFFNSKYDMLYGRVVHNSKEKELAATPQLLTSYMNKLKLSKKTVLIDYVKKGKILLLLSVPIQQNAHRGKSNGLFVIYKILNADDFKNTNILNVNIIGGSKQNSYKLQNFDKLILCNTFEGATKHFCIQSTLRPEVLKTFYYSTLYAILMIMFISSLAVILIYILVHPMIKKLTSLSKNVDEMVTDGTVKTLPEFEAQEFQTLTDAIQSIVNKLHNNEQMLKFILDNVPVGIFIYQPNILYANSYTLEDFKIDAKKLSSYTPDMLLDESVSKAIRQEIQKTQDARIKNKDVGARNYELQLNINGIVLDVIAVSQSIIYKGKPAGIVGFIDNTESNKTKEELSELLHYLPLVAYRTRIFKDESYQITVSNAIEKLTGFTRKEVESSPSWWQEHIYEPDREEVLSAQGELFQKGYLEHQYRLECKDGSYIWIDNRAINLNKDDMLQDILGFWNEITTLKLHEAANKAIAKIDRHFLIQNDEEEIFFYICKHTVESEFCEQVVLTRQSGKKYSYPESATNFKMQKHLEVAYADEVLEIDFYLKAKITKHELFENIFTAFKNNVETGLKALLHERRLNYLTYTDIICGFPNANALVEKIKDYKKPFALAMINIRAFSSINLLYGFEFGNEVLCRVADIIKKILRKEDIVYHLSGDRFCVFINIEARDILDKIVKKIAKECAYNIMVEQRHIPISCRFGMAKYPDDSNNSSQIKDLAMTALSYASRDKKETVFYEDKMKEMLNNHAETETRLIDAIAHNKFEFYYQPIVDAKTQKVVHCEALIRLKDENNKPISPEYMIHVAEELGLIKKITKIVTKNVAMQQKIWQQKGLHVKVAINLSSYDIEDEDFSLFFAQTIVKYGLNNKSIAVEITERTAVQNYEAAQKFLQHMKELGIPVEIDDFGVANSSLHQITEMEFDTLKIDKSFVDKILEDEKDREIVNVILQTAKILNVTTLAEGVETKEQYEWLKDKGCDMIQGYYFSKPLCVKDFEAYMLSYKEPLDSAT